MTTRWPVLQDEARYQTSSAVRATSQAAGQAQMAWRRGTSAAEQALTPLHRLKDLVPQVRP